MSFGTSVKYAQSFHMFGSQVTFLLHKPPSEVQSHVLTYDVKEGEHLTQVVAIRPPVVVGQVVAQILQKELLLLLLLHLGYDPYV